MAKLEHKQISASDRLEIENQVQAELVEHLYQGALPGTIAGVPVGIAFLVAFYGHTPTALLVPWYLLYNFGLLVLTLLYFHYQHDRQKYTYDTWLKLYSVTMTICAVIWAFSVYLIPDNTIRQYFAIIALYLVATGYATGSIGVFKLGFVTINIIIIPLIIWCFLKGELFYNLLGSFSIIYTFFMSGINRRSTMWFKDSLKLKLENSLVSYQANHDFITDLPNQRLLEQYLDHYIQEAATMQRKFALVSFSLNRMEIINDTLGHQAGDRVIKSLSERLLFFSANAENTKNPVHYEITISRKDTFNIIIYPVTEISIREKVEALFNILDEPFYLDAKGLKLTASAGIALYPKDSEDPKKLLINADAAMLQAKQFGGNRFEFYRSELNASSPNRLELENDLHQALKRQELMLHYQPLIDLRTGRITGMEALLRWPHPKRGFVSPMHFIPVAEETGLIVPIGEWVLHEACMQTKIWHQMGHFLKVAVNLSEKQLRDVSIIDTIKRILVLTGFEARYLELELTETAILDESIIDTIQEFKRMGLSLAVDDFGTGYSGLSYLKRFSIDKLKIDQSFIRDIPENNDSMTIVSAIIAMAKELKLNTLAEGVETNDQLQFLITKECDFAQGYFFSKPLEAKSFTQLILSHHTYKVSSEVT